MLFPPSHQGWLYRVDITLVYFYHSAIWLCFFGPFVSFSAVQFSIHLAVRIRPYEPVCLCLSQYCSSKQDLLCLVSLVSSLFYHYCFLSLLLLSLFLFYVILSIYFFSNVFFQYNPSFLYIFILGSFNLLDKGRVR